MLTNTTIGGEGTSGYKFTKEQRKNHSKSMKKAYESLELRKTLSERMKGFKHSEETKLKISENNSSRRSEIREKISLSKKGTRLAEETKRKIGIGVSKERNGMYGITGENHHLYGKRGAENQNNKGKVWAYYEGELKFEWGSGSDGIRYFQSLGKIKTDKSFSLALKKNGPMTKGALKGWEIIRTNEDMPKTRPFLL